MPRRGGWAPRRHQPPQDAILEPTLCQHQDAVVVDHRVGVVVDLVEVHVDAVLAPVLPVLRRCLRHKDGLELLVRRSAGEAELDLLGYGAQIRSPSSQINHLHLCRMHKIGLNLFKAT